MRCVAVLGVRVGRELLVTVTVREGKTQKTPLSGEELIVASPA